jgi:1,4-dihydroxy-6-naphthoate synthase
MNLTLGISSCPNDTFIFDAMVHGKIDTEGLNFDLQIADVEELNRRAFLHEIHMTKLSYHAFAYVAHNYRILNAGSALGRNNGPLVIGKRIPAGGLAKNSRIAIPGKYTTANLLFSIFFPSLDNKMNYLFSDIENAVFNGDADAGVIIHESRFTFEKKGLSKIADLGEMWEQTTSMPIPLGCIAVDRSLSDDLQQKLGRVMKRSVIFALENPESSGNFVKKFAQETVDEIIQKHIRLYVNDFTVELGSEGKQAVERLFLEGVKHKVIAEKPENYLVLT